MKRIHRVLSCIIITLLIITLGSTFKYDSYAASAEKPAVLELGSSNSSLLMKSGTLLVWGSNEYGELGLNSKYTQIWEPRVLMDGVTSVSFGCSASAAIKTDGNLWMWGSNEYNQLLQDTNKKYRAPIKVLDNIKYVSTNGLIVGAIDESDDLYMWGHNGWGAIGNGSTDPVSKPYKVLSNVKSVCADNTTSAAITNNGDLYVWGYYMADYLPKKIMSDVKFIGIGYHYFAAIKNDDSLWIWGGFDSIINFTGKDGSEPIKIMDDVKMVSCGLYHIGVVKKDGSLWLWGKNNMGQIGNGTDVDCENPTKIMDNVNMVSCEYDHTGVIKNDGSIWTWGSNDFGQLGYDKGTTRKPTRFRIPIDAFKSNTLINKKQFSYTGKAIKPTVKISNNGFILKKDVDYKVEYSNNINPGTGKVIIKGKGNYKGKITKSFKIKMPSIEIKSLKGGNEAFIINVKKASLTEQKRFTGYQVRYSTKKSFKSGVKTKFFAKTSVSNLKVTNVKPCVKYYVKIRKYLNKSGEKYYSDWSAVKSVKAKLSPVEIKSMSGSSRNFKVLWEKATSSQRKTFTGYEIWYSTNEHFSKGVKKEKSGSNSVSSYTSPDLKKGVYYIKIRKYLKKNGNYYYSAWSRDWSTEIF